jgi:hypothetical protein
VVGSKYDRTKDALESGVGGSACVEDVSSNMEGWVIESSHWDSSRWVSAALGAVGTHEPLEQAGQLNQWCKAMT